MYIFKKALFLLHAVHLRFGTLLGGDAGVSIPDTSGLPVFADNVLPSILVHLGIINLATGRREHLTKTFLAQSSTAEALLSPESEIQGQQGPTSDLIEGPTLFAQDAYIIRAAAVTACETILRLARDITVAEGQYGDEVRNMSETQLDGWLWSISKKNAVFRALPRFVQTSTPFF